MKNVYYFILLLVMFAGCKNTAQHENQSETITEDTLKTVWESQLNTIKDNPVDLLVASGISLVDYQFVDDIDNEQKLIKYRNILKEEQDMLPYYNQSLDTIKVVTKEEALKIKSAHQTFTFDELNEYIDERVQDNMKIIRLTWDNNGIGINTLCVVSDKMGIVYDCFLINTLVFKVENSVVESEEISIPYNQ